MAVEADTEALLPDLCPWGEDEEDEDEEELLARLGEVAGNDAFSKIRLMKSDFENNIASSKSDSSLSLFFDMNPSTQ